MSPVTEESGAATAAGVPASPWHRLVTAEALHKALVAAGVIRDGERIRRLVIDAKAWEPVVIHVERFGDERLLDVVRSLEGIEVHCGGEVELP